MAIVQVRANTTKIPLGRQGENLAHRVQFNISAWQAEFGPGRPALIHKRNGDTAAYPVELKLSGGAAYWDVTSVDNENPGNGKCELSYYVNDVIAKSATYITVVQPSMNEHIGFEPQDVPNWVDTVNAAIAKAEAATQAAEAATKAAQEAAEEAKKVIEDSETSGGGEISDESIADDTEVDTMLDEIFGDGSSTEDGAASGEESDPENP